MRTTYDCNKSLKVINLFGGPGVGKSTTAAQIFANMKIANFNVELVHECAKDYVYERMTNIFGEQDIMFANQHRKLRRLVDHNIEWAVSDSPILLPLFYMPKDIPTSLSQFIEDTFDTYSNINIILQRNDSLPYIQVGRNENLEQAQVIDANIQTYFDENNITFHVVQAGSTAVDSIFDLILYYKAFQSEKLLPSHI